MNAKAVRATECEAMLRKFCPKGTTVYGIVRRVSRSGMSRVIDFVVVVQDKEFNLIGRQLQRVSGWMAGRTGRRMDKSEMGYHVNGCGMDMIFHEVSNLSRALYGDDYAIRSEQL